MTVLQEAGGDLILLLVTQGDHPRGRAQPGQLHSPSPFLDHCSLIEIARLSRIGPGAIILDVFRLPTCGR